MSMVTALSVPVSREEICAVFLQLSWKKCIPKANSLWVQYIARNRTVCRFCTVIVTDRQTDRQTELSHYYSLITIVIHSRSSEYCTSRSWEIMRNIINIDWMRSVPRLIWQQITSTTYTHQHCREMCTFQMHPPEGSTDQQHSLGCSTCTDQQHSVGAAGIIIIH